MDKIPVLLLAGYLGSGKTTLLNRILNNRRDIRFAVIVNDIGEINIDADLIGKGGIVGQDDSGDLVALQNGCICCTLRTDLIQQISQLAQGPFDYIVIEASGVCEPAPIAQTICAMEQMPPTPANPASRLPYLDSIVTIVDALRLSTEFGNGHNLKNDNLEEDDIENLIIEQIEFCNTILLNKVDEVSKEQLSEIKAIIRSLQPDAPIFDCNYADIDLDKILYTDSFNFDRVATSATWVKEIEAPHDEHEHEHHHEHHHEHEHHHHHHDHNHDEGEALEYGIGTFVYFRRRPFDFDKFDRFVNLDWPQNIIRTKGVLYFSHNRDMSLLFEQAGVQKNLKETGYWFATAPAEDLRIMMERDPQLRRDWDDIYGDRMIKLVFIGRNIDKEKLAAQLDACLASR